MPDTAYVRTPIADQDAYDGISGFGEPVEIRNVRWNRAEAMRPSQHVFTDGSTGLLFIDARNSEGAFEVQAGSLVTVRGEERVCVKTTPFEDFEGNVHHWECELR